MPNPSGRVTDKVALVTGAAGGIGEACATRLAREGATTVITDVQDKRGEAVAEALMNQGCKAVYLHLDVADASQWRKVIDHVVDTLGAPAILVNNAAFGVVGPIETLTEEQWNKVLSVNLTGTLNGITSVLAHMSAAGGGSIINMSSTAGLRGSPGMACYGASKGGVRSLTKAVALECAQSRNGVRVNSVHPGIIDTAIWENAHYQPGSKPEKPLSQEKIARHMVPVGYAGTPDDVANGVLFLASDESSYITGTELIIDGGLTAR